MVEQKAIIQNDHGIHCRPSAVIIKETIHYSGEIRVACAAGETDLRSVVSLLMLGLEKGQVVRIAVNGPDEGAVCAHLVELFERHFDFPPLAEPPSPRELDASLHG